MDNVTYILLGIALALGRPARGLTRRVALVTGILATNLPDIDIVAWFFGGPSSFVFRHATITHSLAAALVLPFALAAVIALATKAPLRPVWMLAVGGFLGHLGLDAAGTWGIAPLAPFSDVRVGAGWVYLSDLVVWSLLALPMWIPRLVGVAADRASALALGLCVAYVGLLGGLHTVAHARTAAVARAAGLDDATVEVYASPFLPTSWNGIIVGTEFATQVRVRLFGETSVESVHLLNLSHPAARAALETDVGRRYLEWAHVPVAEVICLSDYENQRVDSPMKPGRLAVRFSDLRFVDPWVELPAAALVFDVENRGPSRSMVVTGHRWVTPWSSDGAVPEAACVDAPISPRRPAPLPKASGESGTPTKPSDGAAAAKDGAAAPPAIEPVPGTPPDGAPR